MKESTRGSRAVSAVGQFLRFQTRAFLLPDGATILMDWVGHPGAAAVIAVDGDGRLCMLRQYRPIMGVWMWEIPAGKRDAGEAPEVTARRELPRRPGWWRENG